MSHVSEESHDSHEFQGRALRRILLTLAALAVLNTGAGLAFLSLQGRWHQFAPWETDSVLAAMPANSRHEAVVLGSSHAYVFSRLEASHPYMEAAAGGPVFNMALPTGGGVWPARIFLEQYLASRNQAQELWYFLEPFVLYNAGANSAHKFVYVEPFRFSFFLRLIRAGYPPRQIFTYVRSKFSYDGIFRKPQYMEAFHGVVAPETVTAEAIAQRMDSLYLEELNEDTFSRYLGELEKILSLARRHDMKVRLITPPTLIGHEPGQVRLAAALEDLASNHSFEYRDFTNEMRDPSLYYNLDHMNTRGVETFCLELLKPYLDGLT